MFEILFPFTVFFLAYVAYDAYQAVLRAERNEPLFKPRLAVTPPAASATTATSSKAAAPAKEAPKPAATTRATTKPTAAASNTTTTSATAGESHLADTLRNPTTGELSSVPANYRFAKKWIKDALVSEKLLDRVYKPSELDDAASRKVREAIDKLRTIKKYQA